MSLDIERFYYQLEGRFPKGIDCIVFDADGTLFDIKYDSWFFLTSELAKKFDLGYTPEQATAEHTRFYETFESTKDEDPNAYNKMIKGLMSLWTKNGTVKIKRSDIVEICQQIPLRKDLDKVAEIAHTNGVKMGILTASYDILADVMAEKLGLDLTNGDFASANTRLLFDEDGNFSGIDQWTLFEVFKWVQLVKISESLSFSLLKVLAFGDSSTDLEVFKRLRDKYAEYLKQQRRGQGSDSEEFEIVDPRRGIALSSKNSELLSLAFAHLTNFVSFSEVFLRYFQKRSENESSHKNTV